MPEVNSANTVSNLVLPAGQGQIPWDVKQRMMADQLAVQNAAATKGPYTSKAAGLVSALTGGLGGMLEGMEQQKVMQGQAQSRQQMLALADALHSGAAQNGAPAGAPGAAPAGAPAGTSPTSGSFTSANPTGYDPKATEAMVRASAVAHGINPDTAVAVAHSEGLNKYTGDNGSSFGPFQLHYGNVASGGNAVGGMGDDFTKATGLDARDPSTLKQQIDFSMAGAAKNGWGAWHGAKASNIGPWEGIGQAPKASTASADMPAQNAQPVSMAGLPPGVTPAMFAASQNAGGPSDGNAVRRSDEAPAGTKPFVSGSGPQPGTVAPAPAPAPQSDGSVRGDLLASALTHGIDVGQPAIVPPPVGNAMPPSNGDLSGPQSDAAMGNEAPQSDLRAELLSAMTQGADAGQPAVVPPPVGDNMPAPPPSSPNAALAGPQSDAAMGNSAPVPPAPPAAAGGPSFDPEGTGAANYDPSAAPSLRDTIMAAASAPPPQPDPSAVNVDQSAGPGPIAALGATPDASQGPGAPAAPTMPVLAGAGSPPPPSGGPGLPQMAAGNLPAPDMSAPPAPAPGGPAPSMPSAPPAGPQPGTGAALPQTGPMPPSGAQTLAGLNPDAPAPGASNAGPAPLTSPMAQALMSQPQPMGLAGHGGADPSSAQNFNKQQALVSMLGGAGAPAGGAQNGAQSAPAAPPASQGGGIMSGIQSMFGGGQQPSPQPISAPAGGSPQSSGQGGSPNPGYAQARAFAAQILSNPYASPQAQEMAGKILMPQMQITQGADGVAYGVDPVTHQVTKLFDGGAKFDANQSLRQNGQFSQAPAAPMDAAPGHNVITFGANNQPTSSTPIAPTPNFSPVAGTGLAMDSASGNTKAIPGGVNGTSSIEAGGAKVPLATNTGPNGMTATPLLPAGGAPGGAPNANPLGAVQPLIDQSAKNAANAKGLEAEANKRADFLSQTSDFGIKARQNIQTLNELEEQSGKFGTGFGAKIAKFLNDHGVSNQSGSDQEAFGGLSSALAIEERPTGSGALRTAEIEGFKSQAGNPNMTQADRYAAAERLKGIYQRDAQMSDVASNSAIPQDQREQLVHKLSAVPYGLPVAVTPQDAMQMAPGTQFRDINGKLRTVPAPQQ